MDFMAWEGVRKSKGSISSKKKKQGENFFGLIAEKFRIF
jgi:hypothetical protein